MLASEQSGLVFPAAQQLSSSRSNHSRNATFHTSSETDNRFPLHDIDIARQTYIVLPTLYDLHGIPMLPGEIRIACRIYFSTRAPGSDAHCTDPARPLTTTGEELNDRDRSTNRS